MSKTPSRCTSYSRLFSIVDYFSTLPRMPTQADRSSIDSIGSLLVWMLNHLINMILMHPGGGVSNYMLRTVTSKGLPASFVCSAARWLNNPMILHVFGTVNQRRLWTPFRFLINRNESNRVAIRIRLHGEMQHEVITITIWEL